MKTNERPIYFGRDLDAMTYANNYYKWIINEIRPYFGDELAEVGAGNGNISELLLAEQIKRLVAFEPSSNMYPILNDRLKKNNRIETINGYFGEKCGNYENSFDSVIYINALEHIQNDEEELSYVYKSLRKGGHVIIYVPALSFLYSELDRSLGHFRRYHKQELLKLAQEAGFNIIKLKYFDIAGIVPWYITFVLLKQTLNRFNVSLYDRFVVPIMRIVEGLITPPIGKDLILIAQKS